MKYQVSCHLICIKLPGGLAFRILIPAVKNIILFLNRYGRLGYPCSRDRFHRRDAVCQRFLSFIRSATVQFIAYTMDSGRITPCDIQYNGQRIAGKGQRCTLPGKFYGSLLCITAVLRNDTDYTILIFEVAGCGNVKVTVGVILIRSISASQIHIGHIHSVYRQCHTCAGSHVNILGICLTRSCLIMESVYVLGRTQIPQRPVFVIQYRSVLKSAAECRRQEPDLQICTHFQKHCPGGTAGFTAAGLPGGTVIEVSPHLYISTCLRRDADCRNLFTEQSRIDRQPDTRSDSQRTHDIHIELVF